MIGEGLYAWTELVLMMVAPGFKMRKGRLGDPMHGVNVGLHRGVELVILDVLKVLRIRLAPGIVHQDVQPAKGIGRILDQLVTPLPVLNVPGQQHGLLP